MFVFEYKGAVAFVTGVILMSFFGKSILGIIGIILALTGATHFFASYKNKTEKKK